MRVTEPDAGTVMLAGKVLEVVSLIGTATRRTLDTTSATGSCPQVSMICSNGLSETETLLEVIPIVELPLARMVELYTVWPSMTTAKLQSVATALLRRDSDDMTVRSMETATPSPDAVSGAAASTEIVASPLAGADMSTAVSPLNVMNSAFDNVAPDRSTEAVADALVVVPVEVTPKLELKLSDVEGRLLASEELELAVVDAGMLSGLVDGAIEIASEEVFMALDWLERSFVC